MDDTIKKLGTIRSQDEGRDAIHIAVFTVQAKSDGYRVPGHPCDKNGHHSPIGAAETIGVIDPFLPPSTFVRAGEWFYVYLKPASITGLRHVWSHPAFAEEETPVPTCAPKASRKRSAVITDAEIKTMSATTAVTDAERRVRIFCDGIGIEYDDFIAVLTLGRVHGHRRDLVMYDDYIVSDGTDLSGDIPSGILQDVEVIIGTPLTTRPTHFSCAC